MPSTGHTGLKRGRPPKIDAPTLYLVACELVDNQPRPPEEQKITESVRKVIERVETGSTYREANVRRVRRKFKQQGLGWLVGIAKKYGLVDEYDPLRLAYAPLATPDPTKEGAFRFSQARVMQPRLTREGVILDSPRWSDMARNGWHPVQKLAGDEWIIERYLQRVLTPEEHEAECAAYFEQIAQLGSIEIDGGLQEDDGVLPPDSQ